MNTFPLSAHRDLQRNLQRLGLAIADDCRLNSEKLSRFLVGITSPPDIGRDLIQALSPSFKISDQMLRQASGFQSKMAEVGARILRQQAESNARFRQTVERMKHSEIEQSR